jgi:mercuric ion binding protein
MKNILSIGLIAFLSISTLLTSAQEKKVKEPKIRTISFTVQGSCGECKTRIEKAAYSIRGVRVAEWKKQEQILKVSFSTKKVTEEQIHNAVAAVGHSTSKVKVTPEAYNNLPGCCQYEQVEIH